MDLFQCLKKPAISSHVLYYSLCKKGEVGGVEWLLWHGLFVNIHCENMRFLFLCHKDKVEKQIKDTGCYDRTELCEQATRSPIC